MVPPFLVTAADTLYAPGTVAEVLAAWDDADAGAITIRRQPGRPAATRIRVEDGLVRRVPAPDSTDDVTAAPLLVVGRPVAAEIPAACREPYVAPYELDGRIPAGNRRR